jgi:hypothetical protein
MDEVTRPPASGWPGGGDRDCEVTGGRDILSSG